MKLTQYDRQAFVKAVLNEVPEVDYGKQAQDAIRMYERSVMPAELAPVYDSPKFSGYLSRGHYVNTPRGLPNFQAVIALELPPALREKLDELATKAREQNATREALCHQLTAAVGACTTLKQAIERMPELEKYLPQDRSQTGVTQLPVIANLVTDLMKAGWKGGK